MDVDRLGTVWDSGVGLGSRVVADHEHMPLTMLDPSLSLLAGRKKNLPIPYNIHRAARLTLTDTT